MMGIMGVGLRRRYRLLCLGFLRWRNWRYLMIRARAKVKVKVEMDRKRGVLGSRI